MSHQKSVGCTLFKCDVSVVTGFLKMTIFKNVGLNALLTINAFMSKHYDELYDYGLFGSDRHHSMARGNEGCANIELTAEKALAGDLHAMCRYSASLYSAILDRNSLPEPLRQLWDTYDALQKAYSNKIEPLEKLVREENRRLEVKKYTYHSIEELVKCAQKIDPLTEDVQTDTTELKKEASVIFKKLFEQSGRCENLPLCDKAGNTIIIPNERHENPWPNNTLGIVMLLALMQKSVGSDITAPTRLTVYSQEEKTLPYVAAMLDSISKKHPETLSLLNETDDKLETYITARIEKIMANKSMLAMLDPEIKEALCTLEQDIRSEKIIALPEIPGKILPLGATYQEPLHPCPHLARLGVKFNG